MGYVYTFKIKQLCDSLGSINVNIDDDEMVQICLSGLAPRFDAIPLVILAIENPPSFLDLWAMLMVKKTTSEREATNLTD